MRLLNIFLVSCVAPSCDLIFERIWLTNFGIDWLDLVKEDLFCSGLEFDNEFWQYLTLANKQFIFCSNARDMNPAQTLIWNDWKRRYNYDFEC